MGINREGLELSLPSTTNTTGFPLWVFAKNFLKHPNLVGWMLPSSPFVVSKVLRQIDWSKAKTIVEYGPGVGTFTSHILQQMAPDAKLIAFEINPEFCEHLRNTLPNDPRLVLVQESAVDAQKVLQRMGLSQVDYVISGIPFKSIPRDLRPKIVEATRSILKPGGKFLVYQLSSAVLPYLRNGFSKIQREFELLSFMPGQMFYCEA